MRGLIGSTDSEMVKLLAEVADAIPGLARSPPLDPEAENRDVFETLARFLLGPAACEFGTWLGSGRLPVVVVRRPAV
jgi:hypothetical protein